MKVKLSVAVLAACSALAMAMPVSAQFKDLKSFKKVLETAKEVLEEPKPTAQPQPEPAAKQVPAYRPTQSTVPSAPNQPPPQPLYDTQVPASKVIRLGSDFPHDMKVASGAMPALIKNSLETVTNCGLSYATSEDGNPQVADHVKGYDFEMIYNPNTNSIEFGQFEYREYPGSDPRNPKWEESRSDFASAFEKIGVDGKISEIKIKYVGNNDLHHYFQLNMISHDKTFLINLFAQKDLMEWNAPVIGGEFSNGWGFGCDNPENNG